MMHNYWNDWYFGWGWILWLGLYAVRAYETELGF